MRKILALLALACVALSGCCNNRQCNTVVKETYIHKYGVPVTQTDWEKQGEDGQIVSLQSDGVTVTTSYLKGVQHGPTSYTYPNSSTVQRVFTFDSGTLISRREHYPSGVPMKEEVFEGNVLVKLIRWYEDGTPQASECYQGAFLLTGEYRTPLNVVESRIVDGFGTRICRSNEGDLLSKDNIQNGQMVERVTYYANGDPSTITPFRHGVVEGTRLTFLQGGIPNSVEQWENNHQEGLTVVYQNGEKIAEVAYSKGMKNGIELRYRDGKHLVEEVTWKDNVKHGQRKVFVDGEEKSEWYHEGEVVTKNNFDRLNLLRKPV